MSTKPTSYTLATWISSYNHLVRDIDRSAAAYGIDPEGPQCEQFRRLLADYRREYEGWINAQKAKRRRTR